MKTFEPWSSDRNFGLWRYGVGHSRLIMRSSGKDPIDIIQLEFNAVERIELSRYYLGGISLISVESHENYPESLRYPRLLFEISGPTTTGFVAAAGVRITRISLEGEYLELLHHSKEKDDQ